MIDGFLRYLRHERNYSELTVLAYERDLRDFASYLNGMEGDLSWSDVDADMVRGWMEQMMDKGNSATSVNRRLSALRSFYRYAMGAGMLSKNPAHAIEGPKKKKPLPCFVKEKEMDDLLEPEMWEEDFASLRARTILLVFYSTGIRLSELIGLDDDMVDLEKGELKVHGKRDKQRIIPFGEEMREAIEGYMTRRNAEICSMCDALFVTDKGERMNRNKVRYEVVKALSRVTTQQKRTPHVLRHTFATAMLNHDAGIESVKKLLGHESMTTTEIYTHATFEQLKRVYNSAHPRA